MYFIAAGKGVPESTEDNLETEICSQEIKKKKVIADRDELSRAHQVRKKLS